MNSREAFEDTCPHFNGHHAGDYWNGEFYTSQEVDDLWEIWQSSRKQLLKELSEKEPVAYLLQRTNGAMHFTETIPLPFIVETFGGVSPLIIRPTEEE